MLPDDCLGAGDIFAAGERRPLRDLAIGKIGRRNRRRSFKGRCISSAGALTSMSARIDPSITVLRGVDDLLQGVDDARHFGVRIGLDIV